MQDIYLKDNLAMFVIRFIWTSLPQWYRNHDALDHWTILQIWSFFYFKVGFNAVGCLNIPCTGILGRIKPCPFILLAVCPEYHGCLSRVIMPYYTKLDLSGLPSREQRGLEMYCPFCVSCGKFQRNIFLHWLFIFGCSFIPAILLINAIYYVT